MVEGKVVERTGLTIVKHYSGISQFIRVALPFSVILTLAGLYVKVLWAIPVGSVKLKDIVHVQAVKGKWVGLAYFHRGVVVKYKTRNKVEEIIFWTSRHKQEGFIYHFKKLGVKIKK